MRPALVFDLDGTLVDSAPDIAGAVNRMLAQMGHAPLTLAQITAMIGQGVRVLIARVLVAREAPADRASIARAHALFAGFYAERLCALTRPYDGVAAGLETLAAEGWTMGVCTNKPVAPARIILDTLGMSRFFGGVVGGDETELRKPDPAPFRLCLERMDMPEARAVMIGDSLTDAQTARAAGAPFVLCTGGYRAESVEEIAPDAVIDHFSELRACLPDLQRGGNNDRG